MAAWRTAFVSRGGAAHLMMTPIELLAKIASLVPPPKRPLLRLSEVLGSGSTSPPSGPPSAAKQASPTSRP
jgi:hypothetical protein